MLTVAAASPASDAGSGSEGSEAAGGRLGSRACMSVRWRGRGF
jgi:hypothetical protein